MTPEHYAKVRDLFFAVYERPVSDRKTFLEEHAAPAELRTEVEALLAQHDELTTFLDESDLVTLAADAEPGPAVWTPAAGEIIGPYVVRRVLGEGGFGIVCEAEQTKPVQRTVALKILKAGLDTREVIARFEAERQALALMEHRFIAKVLDAGATEMGRPYFVMEYVPGVPITQFCREQGLGVEAKLQLFLQVCEAIEHAHQKGIIHRDIKPSNVMVTVQGERRVPKIIDFGIAKATGPVLGERTTYTAQGQLVGTPAYMSPEQADLGSLDIDTRSDIYSLGALLYELLVGVPAFGPETLHGKGMVEIRRILREQEPPKPSTRVGADDTEHPSITARSLQRRLRGDLDWIVLKSMEKDRTRRYATTRELALDIKRHLAFEPVIAGPPSGLYLISKFVRRHRAGVAASIMVMLVLITSLWLVTLQSRRAESQAMVASSVIKMLGDLFTSSATGAGSGVDPETLARVTEALATDAAFSDDPETRGRIFGWVAYIHKSVEDYEQAVHHWEQSLELRRQALGEDHPDTLMNMNNLVATLRRLGRLEESVRMARSALDLSKGAPDSALALKTKAELATTLRVLGEHDEARRHLEEALVGQKKLGEESFDTLNTMSELARLLVDQNDYLRAAELMDEVARVGKKLRPHDKRTLAAVYELSAVQVRLGRHDEAAQTLQAMLETLDLEPGDDRARGLRRKIDELRGEASGVHAEEATSTRDSTKTRGGT